MSAEAIAGIRAVRTAAHDLANVCAAVVGGTEMAISVSAVETLGRDPRGLASKAIEQKGGRA